jgi:hypothetical protein
MNEAVVIAWTVDDIKTLRPDWTEDQCADFLDRIEDILRERSIEFGWSIIESELPD